MILNTLTRDLSFAAIGVAALMALIYTLAAQPHVGSWRAMPAATTEPEAVSTARGIRNDAVVPAAIAPETVSTARGRN
jgi:hypothetical protein